jgi:uncharacterized Zn finger protein
MPAWVRNDRTMTVIEISEDRLRRTAGDDVFGQAEELAGKVTGLRPDGLAVTATVDGQPVSVRFSPEAITGVCDCPAGGLCAHATAAALAWVRAGSEDDGSDDTGLEDTAELRAELRGELDALERDAASGDLAHDWYPDTDDLTEMLDDAADLLAEDPEGIRALSDDVITRIQAIMRYERHHGDELSDALKQARELRSAADEASVLPIRAQRGNQPFERGRVSREGRQAVNDCRELPVAFDTRLEQ